jgi:hypothetical protein
LDVGFFFKCHWKNACHQKTEAANWWDSIAGCTGVEAAIYRHIYIFQVVYERNLYFGLGPILKTNSKLADFSWWLFEIIQIK